MLESVNKFPIEGIDELLKRRLQEPLENAISNCKKLEDKVKASGLEDNKKYLESLLSKIRSVAERIGEELNTFMFEPRSFMGIRNWRPSLSTGLGILKNELSAKIAGFAKQPSHIDGDGFMAFSRNFKSEWNQIEQQMDQVSNRDIASTMERYRTELNDLAESAMEKTASLTDLITLKLDQLVTKCHAAKPEGPMIATKEKESQHQQQPTDAFLNEEPQFEAKKNEINAKKDIISDIGMFDGAAYKVLVRFEHEELDKTDFSCAELEKAVEKDKEMVLQAYQVKNIDE
uniref:Uncharacterized protein n=1 Tax=Globodera rostochiensis TaxID=31243 RepID=A0A914HMI0_GLORO